MLCAGWGRRLSVPGLVLALALGHDAAGAAASPSAGSPAAIRAFTDQAVAASLAEVDEEGRPRDSVGGWPVDSYGAVALGYAGMRAAVRTGDRGLLARSIGAVMVSVRHRHATPFDFWLTAKATAWAQRHLRTEALWRAVEPEVVRYLDDPPRVSAEFPAPTSWLSLRRYTNWQLVELAGTSLAVRTGYELRGWRRARAPRIATLARRHAAAPVVSSWVQGRARALSDPPSNPLAYTAFSAALLRDAQRARPSLVPAALRRVRGEVGRYLAAMTAPNGTVAWGGRSEQMSWTLAAAMVVGIDSRAREERGMANAAWQRLRTVYGYRPDGTLAIAPVLRDSNDARGLDSYASSGIYAGLTAVLLNDAADALDYQPPLRGRPPAATRSGTIDDRRGSGGVAQRHGSVWWAATVRPSLLDPRYQAGLNLVQVRRRGRWVDVLPARPRLAGTGGLWPRPEGCRLRPIASTELRCKGMRLRIRANPRSSRVDLLFKTRPYTTVTGVVFAPLPIDHTPRRVRWPGGSLTTNGALSVTTSDVNTGSVTDRDLHEITYELVTDYTGRGKVSIGR